MIGPFASAIAGPITRPITQAGAGGGVFTPLNYFDGTKQGGFYDLSGLSDIAQDTAGTTPSVASSDAIAYMTDASGNANTLIQATGANAMLLKFDADGVPYADTATGRCLYSSAAFDLSASNKVTVVAWFLSTETGTGIVVELSANAVITGGAFYISSANSVGRELALTVRGSASYSAIEHVGGTAFTGAAGFSGDLSAGTASAAFSAYEYNRKVAGLSAIGGSDAPGGGNFAAAQKLNVGARDASAGKSIPINGKIYGLFVYGGALAAAQIREIAVWGLRRYGFCIAASIGDSTVSAYSGNSAVSALTAKMIPQEVAVPGDTIAQQETAWSALSADVHSAQEAVMVQVGLNDLNPAEAASVAIARLQGLVDMIRADVEPGCKIFISKMIPCRARLIAIYGGTNGQIAYQKWLDINAAIAGSGATPITGVDGRITAHEPLMNDGSGNLAAAYDTGDGIHPNNAGRQVNADAWRDALVTAGLLKAI